MKKLGFIILAVVLALGALGAGYAAWTDQLIITGSVNTGELSVGIKTVSNTAGNGNGVATVSYSNSGAQIGSTGYYKSISYSLGNAYPDFTDTVVFEIKNLGSIPVKIDTVSFVPNSGNTTGMDDNIVLTDYTVKYNGATVDTGTGLNYNLSQIGSAITYLNSYEEDMTAGKTLEITFTYKLVDTNSNSLPENGTYGFTFTVNAIQAVP